MDTYETLLADQTILKDMAPEHVQIIADCASQVRFSEGEFLFREGEFARRFYIIQSGRVALEVFAPGRGHIILETLSEGDVLGWSWLFDPYRWHFDTLALTDVKAVAFDALCMRGKCEADHDLGYDMVKRFSRVFMDRLNATRLALLDVMAVTEVSQLGLMSADNAMLPSLSSGGKRPRAKHETPAEKNGHNGHNGHTGHAEPVEPEAEGR